MSWEIIKFYFQDKISYAKFTDLHLKIKWNKLRRVDYEKERDILV